MKQETILSVQAILPDFTGTICYKTRNTLMREKNARMDLFLVVMRNDLLSSTKYKQLSDEIITLNQAIVEICDDLIAYEKTNF